MSELIRHLRHGGPTALAAAKTLLEAKPKLTPAEVAEVKRLLPELRDLFGQALSEGLSNMLSGFGGAVPVALETLMPNLERVPEQALPGRFGTDLQLVRPQLVNHPALSRPQKAERLFAFLVPFLSKLVKASRDDRAEVAPTLLERARDAGYGQLRDQPTGRDGVQIAEQLLEAPSTEAVQEQVAHLELDAPSWPETPALVLKRNEEPRPAVPEAPQSADGPRAGADTQSRGAAAAADPPTNGASAPERRAPPAPPRRDSSGPGAAAKRTDKRLGPNSLWNVLHLFRADGRQGRESAAQRDEMNRLVVGMALVIGFLTLVAILMFTLR
jgi:hypothetical protein